MRKRGHIPRVDHAVKYRRARPSLSHTSALKFVAIKFYCFPDSHELQSHGDKARSVTGPAAPPHCRSRYVAVIAYVTHVCALRDGRRRRRYRLVVREPRFDEAQPSGNYFDQSATLLRRRYLPSTLRKRHLPPLNNILSAFYDT